jgi:CMP-N,N'-diacetyllegionaminic acid synthase
MKVVALLTGRGNNTLIDKNIMPILGRPALAYPVNAALQSKCCDNFFVSSDCEKILSVANSLGFKPIRRPSELATPTALHKDAINHALLEMHLENIYPDILVVLLANSPTIKPKWIRDCVQIMMEDSDCSAVVPAVVEMDHHPYRAKRKNTDGSIESFFDFRKKIISSNRQELPKCFFLCHNFWVLRVTNGLNEAEGEAPWNFMGSKVMPYEVEESFDIHVVEDVTRAERWLIRNGYESKI